MSPHESAGDGGRAYVSAPSSVDDQPTTVKSNEQGKDRRRKPAECEPAPDQNKEKNSRSRAGNSTTRPGWESPPPQYAARKEAHPKSIQEQVRVFEMRRLTSRQLEKTRRYQIQLGRTGSSMTASTDRQLAHLLTEDFNERAHRGYRIDSARVYDLDSLRAHLQGKTSTSRQFAERGRY